MFSVDYRKVPAEPVGEDKSIRWVVGRPEGAPNFAMRVIEFQPGAVFDVHQHPFEHEIFVVEGEGEMCLGEERQAMTSGQAVYIPSGVFHQLSNVGDTTDKRLLNHEPDERMVSLISVLLQSGIL